MEIAMNIPTTLGSIFKILLWSFLLYVVFGLFGMSTFSQVAGFVFELSKRWLIIMFIISIVLPPPTGNGT